MSQKISITMPELGEGIIEGEVQKWHAQVGDQIKEDQILVEVMTDKASMEIPSTASGKILEINIKEGSTCSVGSTLAVLEGEASSITSQSSKKEVNLASIKAQEEQKQPISLSQEHVPEDFHSDVLVAPVVRRYAKEHSINLENIKGTGLSGRITLEDLKTMTKDHKSGSSTVSITHKGFSVPVLGAEEREPLKGIRKKIALNMQASKQVIPHFTVMEQAGFDKLFQLREQAKKIHSDVKITYLSFVMKVLYHCLLDFPSLNASIDDTSEEIVYKKYYNFGFAADTPKGLLVPVIKDIDQKNIIQISKEIKTLSDQAREGRIKLDDMKGATITITNIGSIAGQWATPIINPPEVAILGMYKMSVQPHYDGTEFKPRKVMNFSITSDHRLVDGALAARFIAQFVERIENPNLLLLEG